MFRNRYELQKALGRRVSKGEWERRSHAFVAHQHKKKLIAVDYERNKDGSIKLGADGRPSPLVSRAVTLVLAPDTPRHSRKVSMSERFMPLGKRERFAPRQEHDGVVNRQRFD